MKETKQTLHINTMDDSGLDLEPERKGEKGNVCYYYSFTKTTLGEIWVGFVDYIKVS